MDQIHIKGWISQNLNINKKIFVNSKLGNIKEMYHFDKNIGHGSFGVVYLARDRFTFQKVAVKVIEKASLKNMN